MTRGAARAACAAALAATLAVLAAGCGDEESPQRPDVVPGRTLTIYTSLPRQGQTSLAATDTLRAQRLALEQARGRAGRFRVRLVALDNALEATGRWDPDRTALNARAALRDETTIAYLGEWDSTATAISLPIFNEAGILQVSATSTYVGFTRTEGAGTGEPERFFPSGQRTFARVVPADHVQASALATVMAEGCFDAHLVDDGSPEAQGVALLVQREARDGELDVTGRDTLGEDADGRSAVADRVERSGADCLLLAAAAPPAQAVALLRDLRSVRPGMRVFATAGLADDSFTRTLPPEVEGQLRIATPTVAPDAYPPAGRRVLATYRERYGRAPDVRALYGYEALRAVLRAIEDAGDLGNDRSEVVRAFFNIEDRASVLGTYDIDENGDTTLPVYGVQRVRDGRLTFDGVVELDDG